MKRSKWLGVVDVEWMNSLVQAHAHCVISFHLLVEKYLHGSFSTHRVLDLSSQSVLCPNFILGEGSNVIRVEEHVTDDSSSLSDLSVRM